MNLYPLPIVGETMSFIDDFDFDGEEDPFDRVVDGLWTTKDGRILRIVDMEDKHLVNAIKYLRKKAAIQICKIYDGRSKSKPSEMFPSYKIMVDELKRRVALQEKLKAMESFTQIKVRKLDL